MARKENIYVIQKFVKASSLAQALKRESKAEIADITLTIGEPNKPLTQAIGFFMRPDGNENIEYN